MDIRWRNTPKRVESSSSRAMLRAAESSQLLRKRGVLDGHGIGMALEANGIGDFVDGGGDLFQTIVGSGGNHVFAGGQQGGLIEADD
jgi:hypothetical protein